jgi:PAS domain S-box-containing protein
MRQTTNILLIEDNEGDAFLVKNYMKDAAFKYELFVAESFFEGIDIINRQEIDLVLLDLSLPDSQGFKTLSRYLESSTGIPVIVLTGVNNEIVGNQAVKAGAQDFLVKGQYDGKLLGRAIRFALQRHKDVQKLEESNREMKINESRIVKAQQLAGFGNWEMDLVSNEMIWTDEIFRIFGYHPGSITTGLSDYLSYVHYEDRDAVEQMFDKAIKDGKLKKIEHRIVVDGTSIKWLATHAQVFYDDLTSRTLLVGGVQDITERKLSEQLIMEQNISQQTSILKDKALQEMSFHIRTPLSSIVNLLYLMDSSTVSQQQREYVNGLKESVNDLQLMVNNMLNFSMLVSQNLKADNEELPVRDFIQSLHKIIQIKVDNAKGKLDFSVADELPNKFFADAKKITQIIYNLTDHAIRHTPTANRTDHTTRHAHTTNRTDRATRHTPTNNHIHVSLDIQAIDKQVSKLLISCAYTGQTLTIAQIKELTEENKILETIKNDASEADKQQLSLAIVSKLVKILSGSFNIVNKGTETTVFEIELPIKVVKLLHVDATAPEAPVKILLVEDHSMQQMAIERLLKAWSPFVTVDIAENGMVAVEKFKAYGYDLILMDLQMPVMNGFDAIVRIREKSRVPIIALSATANKAESDRCFELGVNNYIGKPFKVEELYIKIMNTLVTAAHNYSVEADIMAD